MSVFLDNDEITALLVSSNLTIIDVFIYLLTELVKDKGGVELNTHFISSMKRKKHNYEPMNCGDQNEVS